MAAIEFATCLHEAGHALVAVTLGFRVLGTSVTADGDRTGVTECALYGQPVDGDPRQAGGWLPSPTGVACLQTAQLRTARGRGAIDDQRLVDVLTVLAAGTAAEALAVPPGAGIGSGSWSDYLAMDAVAAAVERDGCMPASDLVAGAYYDAARVLGRNRAALVALALALMARGSLDGLGVTTVLASFQPFGVATP